MKIQTHAYCLYITHLFMNVFSCFDLHNRRFILSYFFFVINEGKNFPLPALFCRFKSAGTHILITLVHSYLYV